jgi:HTH-type transcriptional regulator/antitoxin HipB
MWLQTPADFGALVRERRRTLHLSQDALARKAGASREWIVDLEKGKPRLPLSLVLRTLAALGISLSAHDNSANPKKSRTKPRSADPDQILSNLRRKK